MKIHLTKAEAGAFQRKGLRPLCSPGYSLIELVLTLVLISILAVAAVRFFDIEVFQARGFHDEALSILRYAQKTAVAQRDEVYVEINGTTKIISLCYANAFPCSGSNRVPGPYGLLPGPDDLVDDELSFTVTAGSGVGLAPSTTLFFDALGRPYNAADTIPISTFTANLVITLTGGGVPRTITVEPETGYVR